MRRTPTTAAKRAIFRLKMFASRKLQTVAFVGVFSLPSGGGQGAAAPPTLGLKTLRDVDLPGGATRFDYQAVDSEKGRLYIAHLGADELLVFDIATQKILGQVPSLPSVHGVIVAPRLHKLFVTVTGAKQLAVIDDTSLVVVARIPAGEYPNGLAFADKHDKVYVSNNNGLGLGVVDVKANKPLAGIDIGGGAGNSQYDPVSDRIFVTSHQRPELVEIDPTNDAVVAHHKLDGVSGCHGLLVHPETRRAYIACGGGSPMLVAFDLKSKKQLASRPIAIHPDVLALDPGLQRIYVSSGSGIASVFEETPSGGIRKIGEGKVGPNTHTVAVDPRSHEVFFPIENLKGRPVLRIMAPDLVFASIAENQPASLREVQTIALPGVIKRIDHMAIDPAGQRLFVAALGNGTLEVVDLLEGKRIRSLPGLKEPQGIGYFPEFHKIVVATTGGSVVAFDDRTFSVVATLDGLEDADNIRYDAATKQVYVGYGDGALAIIDPGTMKRAGDIKLPGHPESFRLETTGPLIYVNVPVTKEVVIIDRNKRSIVGSIPFSQFKANYPMSLDEVGHRLFVGTRKPARLVVMDTTSHALVNVACVEDTDDLFYDSVRQRIYVTGGQGFVDVFDARPDGNYPRMARVQTASGARTSLWVPELRRLYVASPNRNGSEASIHVLEAPTQ